MQWDFHGRFLQTCQDFSMTQVTMAALLHCCGLLAYLPICFVAEERLHYEVSHVFSVDGAADTSVLCQDAAAGGRLALQAALAG